MLQNGHMTDLGDKLDQLQVNLSLALNVIETNQYFSTESGHKIGTPWDQKMSKRGSIMQKFPTTFKYVSAPPRILCFYISATQGTNVHKHQKSAYQYPTELVLHEEKDILFRLKANCRLYVRGFYNASGRKGPNTDVICPAPLA